MSRKVKFRIWDNATGSMVKDNWKLYLNGGVSICDTWATRDIKIMQYTGIIDTNGAEVYEGDIVIYDMIYEPREICFNKLNAISTIDKYGHHLIYMNDLDSLKVIGNIYENKDLL